MQTQTHVHKEYSESQSYFGSVRSPIQCEGIERGHRRIAEAAVSGSVNPQFDLGGLLKGVAQTLPLFF
jgi:hypothetical protein